MYLSEYLEKAAFVKNYNPNSYSFKEGLINELVHEILIKN